MKRNLSGSGLRAVSVPLYQRDTVDISRPARGSRIGGRAEEERADRGEGRGNFIGNLVAAS